MRCDTSVSTGNLRLYESMWSVAKTCTGIKALGKTFSLDPNFLPTLEMKRQPGAYNRKSVTVDIIAQDGSKWIKVLGFTSGRKLIYEFARAGHEEFSDDEDDEDADFKNGDLDSFSVLEQAKRLLIASHAAAETIYRCPRIRMIYPQLQRGCSKLVESFCIILG